MDIRVFCGAIDITELIKTFKKNLKTLIYLIFIYFQALALALIKKGKKLI